MTGVLEDVLKGRGMPYRLGVLTAELCTFRIGGPAKLVIEPTCIGELLDAVMLCQSGGYPYTVIGRGSNILFDDGEIETVLIRTNGLDAARVLDGGLLYAHCGVSLGALTTLAAREGLEGLTFACGIPGTVGGAIFMNAGAHGSAILDVTKSVTVLDVREQKIKTLFNHQLNNSYRNSVFQKENAVVLHATFALKPHGDPARILAEMQALRARRRVSQPLTEPSAGSAFRRPAPDVFVSKIIDELGLKGMRVGGAAVSRKHAGFIVNVGGATAKDVRTLIAEIQNIVERERGFRPIPEIRFIPEDR